MEDATNKSSKKLIFEEKAFSKVVHSILTAVMFILGMSFINTGHNWTGIAYLIGSASTLNHFLHASNVYNTKVHRVIIGIMLILLVLVGFKILA